MGDFQVYNITAYDSPHINAHPLVSSTYYRVEPAPPSAKRTAKVPVPIYYTRLSPYVMISSLLCDPNGQKGGGMGNAAHINVHPLVSSTYYRVEPAPPSAKRTAKVPVQIYCTLDYHHALINLLSGGTHSAISQKDCESSCPNLLHSRLSPYVMISSLICDPNGQKGGGNAHINAHPLVSSSYYRVEPAPPSAKKGLRKFLPNLLHSRLSPYVMISSLLCDPNGQKGEGMVKAGTALKVHRNIVCK
ncbi:hypothetical protein CEXT_350311 [Caerostris extrusa]|uniref:Uncharacterized protein n=1 Tax=Caerostris extrusa TaxID=172846 RepID=A0AAV4Y0J4_CAEEX|nr:hypothetical protein CEXT_350311 [Caerostris extrusa]